MQRLPLKFLLSVALVPLSFATINSALANTDNSAAVSQLKTQTVELKATQQRVYLDARLEATNQSTISAQTSGIVEAINFDINDRVEAGQTLIVINNTQQKAGLSQAEANLAQAQAMNEDAQILMKRNRSLFNKKTLSQGELDSSIARAKSAAAAVLAAKAQVKQAQEQLSYTKIVAPYSGIVSQRMVELGELVNPGQPLMTGFSAQPLRASTSIPQNLVAKLEQNSQNAKTQITVKSQGQHFAIDSFTLFPFADSRYSSVQARLDLAKFEINQASAGLIPGAWVKVALPIGESKAISVPQSAIIQQGEVASTYVINKNQQLKLRYVRLGASLDKTATNLESPQVIVLSGLNHGDVIAVNALAAAAIANRSHKAANTDSLEK